MRSEGKTQKVCLLIPDGVGIRNYLYSDVLETLHADEWIIWHALPSEVIDIASQMHQKQLQQLPLAPFVETGWQRWLRETSKYARLCNIAKVDDNDTAFFNWMPIKRRLVHKMFYALVESTGRWVASKYSKITKLERMHAASIRKTDRYKEALRTIREQGITTILCTHQRSIESMPVMQAAVDAGIRAVVAIFSWDNLPKASLACRGNHYLVWSRYMKAELLKYYPEVSESMITITGTPQFDFYRKPDFVLSREAFFQRHGVALDRRIICYSGNEVLTTPYDHYYLEELCIAVRSMPENERPIILFRPVPNRDIERYRPTLEQYADVVTHAKPIWKNTTAGNDWNMYFPLIDDLKELVNIARHCDGVINVGSTVALDFTMFNKPALYINYDHEVHYPGPSTTGLYKLQHFKTMEGLDAVGWVNSKEEWVNKLRTLLDHPETIGKDKTLWRERVTDDIDKAAQRIGLFLAGH